MPGRRMIDESICGDKRLNSVSEGAENLFYRLLAKTDDKGNIFADLDLIKNYIYPRRQSITEEVIKERLLELHNARNEQDEGLIILYSTGEGMCAHFPNFNKHQNLRKDIKPKITYPLHNRNDPLRTCNDPFTQDKISKLSKKVSNLDPNIDINIEYNNLKKIYPKEKSEVIKGILKHMGFPEDKIEEVVTTK